jgi:hypothetical protein
MHDRPDFDLYLELASQACLLQLVSSGNCNVGSTRQWISTGFLVQVVRSAWCEKGPRLLELGPTPLMPER